MDIKRHFNTSFVKHPTSYKIALIGAIIIALAAMCVVGPEALISGLTGLVTFIAWCITTLLNCVITLLNCVISTFVWMSVYLLYPLGITVLCLLAIMSILISGTVISGMIGAVGILASALYSCPAEATFKPWLMQFVETMADNGPSQQEVIPVESADIKAPSPTFSIDRMKRLCTRLIERLISKVMNGYYGPKIIAKALSVGTNTRFLSFGVCRIVFCSGPAFEGRQVTFVGIFNTWVPYEDKKL